MIKRLLTKFQNGALFRMIEREVPTSTRGGRNDGLAPSHFLSPPYTPDTESVETTVIRRIHT